MFVPAFHDCCNQSGRCTAQQTLSKAGTHSITAKMQVLPEAHLWCSKYDFYRSHPCRGKHEMFIKLLVEAVHPVLELFSHCITHIATSSCFVAQHL